MGKAEGRRPWHKEYRTTDKSACVHCGNESKLAPMSGCEYVLCICPDANERRKHGGAKEAGHEKDGN